MTYSDIPRLLSMMLVWLLLLGWHSVAGRASCLAIAGLVILFTLVLALSTTEIAFARRQAFIAASLEEDGSLQRWFRRPYLPLVRSSICSLLLALFLLVSVLNYAPRQWSLSFAVVLLLGLLLPRFYGALDGQVRERFRYTTARRWTLWCGVLLLWIEALVVLLFSSGEDFIGLRWQEVMAHAARASDGACAPAARAAALVSVADALGFWSIQNLHRSLSDPPQALVAGIGLIIAVVLAFLRAYVFGLALIGVVARPWVFWKNQPEMGSTPDAGWPPHLSGPPWAARGRSGGGATPPTGSRSHGT